jgi:hypothetical protein
MNQSKAIALCVCLGVISLPLRAGNILLTGHDDDFHATLGGDFVDANPQFLGGLAFVRNGSSLPVLSFDSGSELTSLLTTDGISFTNINPDTAGAVTAALFDPAKYSAFVVASDSTCGGCDNDPTGEANIAAQLSAIEAFLNAGGGIFALAGANSTNYYAFLPQTASSVGGAPAIGYTQTALAVTLGIPAVNGDPTHNLFFNPGTNGESSAYHIVEFNQTTGNGVVPAPAAVTLACVGCTTSGGVIVTSAMPEPSSWIMILSGLAALIAMRRRIFTHSR